MTRQAQAKAKLNRALLRMASTYSMYAYLLSLRAFQADPQVPTVAVMHCKNQLRYRYNPEFILSISDDELCGVIHHEINHIEFDHVYANPEDMPDRRARTIAEEVTVNEYVPEPLPGRPLTLDQFPELPPGEDTLTRYKRLQGKTDQYRWVDDLQIVDAWRGRYQDGDGMDDSRGHLSRLRERLRRNLDPAYLAEQQLALTSDAPPSKPIHWIQLLRRVGIEFGPRPVFHRPSRRFPQLVGIVPGTTVRGRPRVMAAVDTSGSMSSESLERIGQELSRLAHYSEVTVVECDDVIRATYKLGGPLRGVRGRGSTDLRPPLACQCIDQVRPDVVVYFTDGDGTAPEQRPPVPVIWALLPGGKQPASWGETIQL
jgi:predicted metal-dependent peptidase